MIPLILRRSRSACLRPVGPAGSALRNLQAGADRGAARRGFLGRRRETSSTGLSGARPPLANCSATPVSAATSAAQISLTRFAPVPAAELAGQYWIRSGIAGFATTRRNTSICRNATPTPSATSPRWNTTRATCSWHPAPTRWAIPHQSHAISTFACWPRARCRTSTTTCPKCSSMCWACRPPWR